MYRKIIFIVKIFCLIFIIVFSGCDKDETPTVSRFNSLEEEIDYIAEQYVKVGAMIGIINKQQEKLIFSYGTKAINNNEPPDANTAFDIGSITKTFTTTLLADMHLKGRINNDTVGKYLPPGKVTMPTLNGAEITFFHLATHTSGIPRTPHADGQTYPVPAGQDLENPYYIYTTEDVYDYLSNYCTLEFEPFTWWGYSNTGMGLLGHVLGLIDGTSYESILTQYIFDGLDMDNSSLFLTEQQMTNIAPGYNKEFRNVPFYMANDIFQGCGMIKSTLNDMFKFLEANMGSIDTPLRNAIDLTHQRQMQQGSMGDQGLGWWILDLDDGQKVIYMGGETQGHMAYLGFNKLESTGVIVLLNYNSDDNSQLIMGQEILKAINKY